MAENIWEKSLGQEISTQKPNITYINKNYKYPMEKMYLRNYVNIHSIAEINPESLYQYFGDNIYNDTNGNFITHLLCGLPMIPFEKRYKALQAAFQFISPNTGTIDEYNINYIQYSFLHRLRPDLNYSIKEHTDLYQLGLENGLDKLYADVNGYIISHYFYALSNLYEIKNNYKIFCDPDKNVENKGRLKPSDVFCYRFISNGGQNYENMKDTIKSIILFSQIKESYSPHREEKIIKFLLATQPSDETEDLYKKIKKYYKIS